MTHMEFGIQPRAPKCVNVYKCEYTHLSELHGHVPKAWQVLDGYPSEERANLVGK